MHAQTATINLFAGALQYSSGANAADGGIFFLVADTANNGFASLTSDTIFSVGNMLSTGGDDYIAGIFPIDAGTTGTPGTSNVTLTLNYAAGIVAQNDALQLYWVPTVTNFGGSAPAGTAYGTFRSDSAITTGSDLSISWFAPAANPSAESLTFATLAAGGSYANIEGLADQTVLAAVPEPATTVALLGGAAGLFVIYRRRQRGLSGKVGVS
jgi:hypothetical protein